MIWNLLADLVQLYLLLLFLRIISTWFPINPWSKMAKVVRFLVKITDPVLVPVRRILPPLRLGGMGLDLSPIVVFIAIEILLSVLRSR